MIILKENIKEHNPGWPQVPGNLYRILIIWASGSGKTNALLNQINHKPYTKINLCAKNLYDAKYHLLINKHKGVGLQKFNNSEAFIEQLDDVDDIYENIEQCNPDKKRRSLFLISLISKNNIRW